jgi:hypothetical protein
MTGISISIFRSDLGDCTNGGVTSPARAQGKIFVVFDEAIRMGNFRLEECKDDDRIVCLKVVRRWAGTKNEYLHLEPMFNRPEGQAGPMAGGNYGGCSDSRFSDLSRYPLPIHDRWDTWEQYDMLSR